MGVGGGMISYLFQKIFPSLAWETEYIPEGMEAETPVNMLRYQGYAKPGRR